MNKEKIRQFITAHKKLVVISTIIFVTLSILIYCNLPSTIMRRRINTFHNLCEFYETNGPSDSFPQQSRDSLMSTQRRLLRKCGLKYDSDLDDVMDEEFVDAYIAKYSVEEFIDKLYLINISAPDDHCSWYGYDHCYGRIMNNVLQYALQCAGINFQEFSLPKEGSEGYYTENPDKIPQEETWEVSGSFYSSSGTNVHTETMPCSRTVTVHGDFVVIHYDVYNYLEGEYGWRNGTFYDRLPSWNREVYDVVECKGELREEMDRLRLSKVFSVGGNWYILHPAEECGRTSGHYISEWSKLG